MVIFKSILFVAERKYIGCGGKYILCSNASSASIKHFFLRKAYKISMKQSTATLSNIGKIIMPEDLCKYIKAYDVYTGTNKLQIGMCSYNDTLSLNFTTPFSNTEIQRLFFRKLVLFGIRCDLYTNIQGGEEDEGV